MARAQHPDVFGLDHVIGDQVLHGEVSGEYLTGGAVGRHVDPCRARHDVAAAEFEVHLGEGCAPLLHLRDPALPGDPLTDDAGCEVGRDHRGVGVLAGDVEQRLEVGLGK